MIEVRDYGSLIVPALSCYAPGGVIQGQKPVMDLLPDVRTALVRTIEPGTSLTGWAILVRYPIGSNPADVDAVRAWLLEPPAQDAMSYICANCDNPRPSPDAIDADAWLKAELGKEKWRGSLTSGAGVWHAKDWFEDRVEEIGTVVKGLKNQDIPSYAKELGDDLPVDVVIPNLLSWLFSFKE